MRRAAGGYAESGRQWYKNQQQNKRERMYVLISKNCKNKWCSVTPVESRLGSLMLKTVLFLCKPFSSVWEFASIIFSAVYIPPQAKANGMPGLLSRQIIKIKTKHPTAFCTQGNWRNEFPSQRRREYKIQRSLFSSSSQWWIWFKRIKNVWRDWHNVWYQHLHLF